LYITGILSLGKSGDNILIEGKVAEGVWAIDVNKLINFINKNLIGVDLPRRYFKENEVVIHNWYKIITKVYGVNISKDTITRNIVIPKEKWFTKSK